MKGLATALVGLAFVGLSAAAGFQLARRLRPPPAQVLPALEVEAPLAAGPARRPVELEGLETSGALAAPAAGARWAQRNKLGIEALEAGLLERAVLLFEECAEGVPDEPVFRRNLAEALARMAVRDRQDERPCGACLQALARAVELAPERSDLSRLLERWRLEDELEADFWRESSLHFDLAYDGSRDELLWGSHRLLAELEEGYMDLGGFFGAHPVEEGRGRFPVVLYRRDGFDRLTGLGEWAGGAFDGTLRVPVEDLGAEEAGLKRVLRHELVHAFVAEVGGPGVPGWLNEGLAQWLEGGRDDSVRRARERLRERELFPLDELRGSLARWSDRDAIALAYAQSLVLVDHIARQYGEALLVELVAGHRDGRTAADTFRRRLNFEIDELLDDVREEL